MNAQMLYALIIEDDKLVKWSIAETVKGEGLEVYSVEDCHSAFEMAKKYDFHIILADVGDEKAETLKKLVQIQKIQANSSFVLMTSHTSNEIKDYTGELKVLGILEKPFELGRARALIRESLVPNR